MPHKHVLLAGKIGFYRFCEGAHVLYKNFVAVLFGYEAELTRRFSRFAVTHMVVRENGKTVFREKSHKFMVSADMLGHSVRYLKKRAHLAFGNVYLAVESMYTVGRKNFLFDYFI
jgi:hypothetical protein